MKRIFSSPVVALLAGLCLRLFFVLRYPANSGDTVLYEQIATNWLQHHVYGMNVHDLVTPVDMRMPGYPAFLALLYAFTGRIGEAARLWVMLVQVVVDLLTCLLIAGLAALLTLIGNDRARPQRVFLAALWLAALCPFTANYVAVPLTEVFATFFTTAALLPLCLLVTRAQNLGWRLAERHWILGNDYWYLAGCSAVLVGLCTLFRPEAPLLLLAAWLVLGVILIRQHESLRWLKTTALMAALCVVPVVPWTIRNAITLHEFQPLAPKNSNLPGELVPHGFMSWEKTWLYRFRDVYLVPWKLNEEVIDVNELPSRAFDTPAEKERAAMILEQYNDELTLTPEEDAAFAQLAGERTARRPLRTYLWQVVSHTCLDQLRALSRWQWTELEEVDEGRSALAPPVTGGHEDRDLVQRVLERVSGDCRQMWRLIAMGHSYREMSQRMGVAEGTLRVRVLRCREKAVAVRRELLGGAPARRRNVAAAPSPNFSKGANGE